MERRQFVKSSAALALTSALPFNSFSSEHLLATERKFRLCLNPEIIGVKVNVEEAVDMVIWV